MMKRIFLCILFSSLMMGTYAQQEDTYKGLCENYRFWENEADTSKMIKALKRGYKLYPEAPYFVTNLLAIRLAQKDYNEARIFMKKVVKKVPTEPLYWYIFGQLNEASCNLESAENNYLQALALDKTHVGATVGMGSIYYHRGLEVLKEGEEKKVPKEICIETARPSFSIALQYLEKAVNLQNDNQTALTYLSDIYEKIGDREKYEDVQKLFEQFQE